MHNIQENIGHWDGGTKSKTSWIDYWAYVQKMHHTLLFILNHLFLSLGLAVFSAPSRPLKNLVSTWICTKTFTKCNPRYLNEQECKKINILFGKFANKEDMSVWWSSWKWTELKHLMGQLVQRPNIQIYTYLQIYRFTNIRFQKPTKCKSSNYKI